jgi:hypothetical protein
MRDESVLPAILKPVPVHLLNEGLFNLSHMSMFKNPFAPGWRVVLGVDFWRSGAAGAFRFSKKVFRSILSLVFVVSSENTPPGRKFSERLLFCLKFTGAFAKTHIFF